MNIAKEDMGSETPQLCFSIYAVAEANSYVSAEEVLSFSFFIHLLRSLLRSSK